MTNPIARALALGYGVPKVLDFVEKAFPALSSRIKKAKSSGYGPEQILSLIQKGMGGPDENATESQIHTQRDEKQNALAQDILKLGAGAAGTYAAARGLPAIAKAALGSVASPAEGLLGPASSHGPTPMGGGPIQPSKATSQQVMAEEAPIDPNAPIASPSPMEPTVNPAKEQSSQFFKALGLEDAVIKGVREGKSPQEIARDIQTGLTPQQRKDYQKKRISGQERPIEEHVKEFVTGPQGLVREDIVNFGKEVPPPQSKLAPSAPVVKGDFVFDYETGNIGEVKDLKNREGLMDDNGKVHKVRLDDLEKPSEDVIEAVSNILKIPNVDKSAVISLATYRPSNKQLFIQFHNGQTYAYEDVPESMGQQIAHALGVAKTTGKNVYGAWDEGVQSRGAALIQKIIKDPKYSKENEGKTWEKLGTYYDYWKGLRRHAKRKK